ncbi:MAG TPA: hypothetical protein VFX59_09040 [Polyangiales bacterium]|nr:hypothetical protein [Polyangiales bacterium]
MFIAACSLVVDFPDQAASPDQDRDSGLDARVDRDDGGDVETRDATADGSRQDSSRAECAKDTDCNSDQLCCSDQNVLACVPANVTSCTACGVGCTEPSAPNCGARVCECVKDTGKGCDPGQTCDSTGGTSRCVECANDNDCAGVTGKPLCDLASNKCVQCKRGDNLDSSADDVGCSEVRSPICGPSNTCIGCDDTVAASKCPGMTVCSPGLGCGGCKADVPTVGLNGCTQESAPICRASESGLTLCQACTTNAECKFAEGQGYCANGRCSNKCDGDAVLGPNGCTAAAAPFCKPASNVPGGYDCAACSPADCTNGTFCATTGSKAGSCVQCRMNIDCPQNGLAPICDATSFTCRARTMADCVAPTPFLSTTGATAGTCVECGSNDQCAASAKGPFCNTATGNCGACATSANCPATTPTCDTATNTCVVGCTLAVCAMQPVAKFCNTAMTACVQCNTSLDCPVEPSPTPAPLCAAGACVPCTQYPGSNAERDAACYTKTTGARCFRQANTMSNAYVGLCGICEPGQGQCTGAATCSPTSFVCQ